MNCQKCKCWQEMCERLEKRAALFDECDALIAAVECKTERGKLSDHH